MSRKSQISDDSLKEAVLNSNSIMEVLRFLGLREAGGTHSHYRNRIKKLGLDTSHFTGKAVNKNKTFIEKQKTPEQILVERDKGTRAKAKQLTRALIASGVKHECSKCAQPPTWLGFPLTLDVDHINENWLDDRLENLRFLCPNCHSQFSRKLLGS